MATECTEAQEWIEEEVWKPVDEWVENTEKKCKDLPWYDPRGWLCWLVTTLVKAVVWVVVKVGKWVVRTVCKIVGAIWGFLRDFFVGLWNMLAGIFTWDCGRFYGGLLQMVGGIADPFATFFRIFTFLDTLDYIRTEAQQNQLKTYIRTKLGFKYSGQAFRDIVDNLRVDRGAFGYRINIRAVRTVLDSETPSPDDPSVPNLVALKNGGINVRELCGFEHTEGCTNQKRFKTIKKGLHAAGGGGGEIDDPISSEELDLYLSSNGAEGPKFFVLSMRDGVLDTKLAAAEQKAREIGLIPQWSREDLPVIKPGHVIHSGEDQDLVDFLVEAVGRKPKVHDPLDPTKIDETDALADLCTPVAVGVFRFADGVTLRGLSACLMGSPCTPSVGVHDASGSTFIDNQPDIIWKYVPIHELGHLFGLCHVPGVERIMYTPKGDDGKSLGWWDTLKKSVTWSTLPELLLFKGEPRFTLDEAMQAWDYIIEHFPPDCLGAKSIIIV